MKELLQKLGRVLYQIHCPKLYIVVSRPFLDKGEWKIVYGTYTSYRLLKFATLDAANREFDAIRSFAAYRFGDGVYEFLALTEDQRSRVKESYAEVVNQAIQERNAGMKTEGSGLMSVRS
jgi:hypothetical protein